jgi:hypothetical protein
MLAVLERARRSPFKCKSGFAREMAVWVALAACENLISTRINPTEFTDVWMITDEGMGWMEGVYDVLSTRH